MEPEPEVPKPQEGDPLLKIARDAEEAFPGEVTPGAEASAPGVTPADAELLDPAFVGMMLAMPFDFIAARNGPHWKLTPEEQAAIVPVATRVSNKYCPAILAAWADEAALTALVVMVVSKRMKIDNEAQAKAAAENRVGVPAV